MFHATSRAKAFTETNLLRKNALQLEESPDNILVCCLKTRAVWLEVAVIIVILFQIGYMSMGFPCFVKNIHV
jgi:hypothetical protein